MDTQTRPLYWSIRRELAEHRSIYLAPLIVAALAVVAFSLASIAGIWEKALRLDPTQSAEKVAEPYGLVSLMIMATTFVVGVFYCLDALYGERRDRSILFWKSLPVSDRTTVLAKAIIPILILPLLTFVVTLLAQSLMLMVSNAVLLASGQSAAMLWAKLSFPRMSAALLYHLVTVHGLYYAPMFGWLLLVSAWARRAPFVWAIVPLIAIGALERAALGTTYFGTMLGARMSGGAQAAPLMAPGGGSILTHLHPHTFLTSAGLWVGLAIAAVFLAGAVRLRRASRLA